MGEGSTMSAATHVRAYGMPDVAAPDERSSELSSVLPLLILVVGLAAATIWFVALPVLHEPASVGRSCEVYVLPSGTTKCVPYPKPGSWAAHQKSLRRAEH